MQVRCPQCHTPIDLASDGELSDIACPSCGSSFSLLGSEETAPLNHEQIKTIGHFELTEQIGVGTFGSVWRARDVDLDRTVAVKIPRKGQLDPQESEQFLREARAAAQLRHPGIVSVHEVGREKDTVFIVSDLVDGVTLADRLTAQPFSSREAAELCAKVADALQHAHEAGVIHRDLKTGNIMLDAEGEPHILDFGLARREAGEVTMTVEGRVLGTPAYLSPEQAQGEAHTADGRTDVYSLGVILFELLTGERPFRGNIRMLIHQVIHEEAPSPRRFNSSVPRDLETICLKCLDKDPDKRYQSASELGQDLRRFLGGEPIEARPLSRPERGWRWCRRNPVIAGLSTAVATLLLSGTVVAISLSVFANKKADEAQQKADENRRLRYTSDMMLAGTACDDSNFGLVEQLLKEYIPFSNDEDWRGLEWYLLWKYCKPKLESTAVPLESPIAGIDVSPDGRKLAVAYSYGGVTLLDLDTLRQHPRFGGRCNSFYLAVAFSADGNTLAYVSRPGSNVTLRNVNTGEETTLACLEEGIVNAIAFSADGQFLAVSGEGGLRIWDVWTMQRIQHFDQYDWANTIAPNIAFSPTENKLAVASHDESAFVLDLTSPSNNVLKLPHDAKLHCVAFSPKGDRLITGSEDGMVRLWDIESPTASAGTEIASRAIKPGYRISSVAYSFDGKTVAASSVDYVIELLHAADLAELDALRGLSGSATDIVFLRDGRFISGGTDSTLIIWPKRTDHHSDVFSYDLKDPVPARRRKQVVRRRNQVAFSPDRVSIASPYPGGVQVRNWQGQVEWEPKVKIDGLYCLALSNAPMLAVGYTDGTVLLYDPSQEGPKVCPADRPGDEVTAMAFSHNGRTLVVGTRSGTVHVWDVKSETRRNHDRQHIDAIHAIVFSNTRREFATGGNDQAVSLWSAQDGTFISELGEHKGFVRTLAYAPDGVMLASGGFDPTMKIWNTADPEEKSREVEAHASGTFAIAFSPDGSILATGGRDGEFKLWDAGSFSQRFTMTGHRDRLYQVAFAPDGRSLLTSFADGTFRIWRAATREEVEASEWWKREFGDHQQ